MNIEPGFIGAGFAIVSAAAGLVWKASATLTRNEKVLDAMDEKLRQLEPLAREFRAFEVRIGQVEETSTKFVSEFHRLKERVAVNEAIRRNSQHEE